jgi:ectoine hydroxylase-related dioxygenase (phytanoyl-CoA dioxygenase family)
MREGLQLGTAAAAGEERIGASTAQRLFFETNGYLVLPAALDQNDLETLRAAADAAEARWRADVSLAGWRRKNISSIASIVEYDDAFLDLLVHPRVFPIVRDVLGPDIALLYSDYYITPPRTRSHVHWHQDVGLIGPFNPLSTMYVKAFFLLSDVAENGGPTAVLPGSHKFLSDEIVPELDDPTQMPGAVRMAYPAGWVWIFNARCFHAAMPNETDVVRRALIYSYGHCWMKPWQGYEPSPALQAKAKTLTMKQLLHMREPYLEEYKQRRRPAIGGTAGRPE